MDDIAPCLCLWFGGLRVRERPQQDAAGRRRGTDRHTTFATFTSEKHDEQLQGEGQLPRLGCRLCMRWIGPPFTRAGARAWGVDALYYGMIEPRSSARTAIFNNDIRGRSRTAECGNSPSAILCAAQRETA